MPFGVGAKAACPDKEVVVLHGDRSFGFNALEFDTAVRHKLPLIVVISVNGGWTGNPDRAKPGRDLGYTRYEKLAEALGGHGEYVESPDQIRPILERARAAVAEGKPALVNVLTAGEPGRRRLHSPATRPDGSEYPIPREGSRPGVASPIAVKTEMEGQVAVAFIDFQERLVPAIEGG